MRIHHICIQTNDYEKSIEFYNKVLGFKVIKETKNFHGRSYNTWLELNGFMIELQTGKECLSEYNKDAEGIVHFALESNNIEEELDRILNTGYSKFKLKNNSILYQVEDGQLFKIIAPEGTIIEIRDNSKI